MFFSAAHPPVRRSSASLGNVPLTWDDEDEERLAEDHHAVVVPINDPRAICWAEEALLVASRTGAVSLFRPNHNPQLLLRWRPDPLAMLVADGVLAVACAGYISAWEFPSGDVAWGQSTRLVQDISLVRCGSMLVATGLDRLGRTWLLVVDEEGGIVLEMEIPSRTIAGTEDGGELFLARSTNEGLQKVVLFDPQMFRMLGMDGAAIYGQLGALPEGTPTPYRLRSLPDGRVMGVSHRGLAVWPGHRVAPRTLSQGGLACAAMSPDGHRLAMGTDQGNVMIVPFEHATRMPERLGWVPGGARDLAYSPDGRWLAVLGNVCRIWPTGVSG